ncbi:PKD domain-containing protein [Nanoarchaeota archaeon]
MTEIETHNNKKKVGMSLVLLLSVIALLVSGIVVAQVDTCDVTSQELEPPQSDYQATQLPAEVGKPVQWVKQVDIYNLYDQSESELIVLIPEDAQNVVVIDIATDESLDVIFDAGEVRILDSLEFDEKKSYLIRYETSSPEKTETVMVRNGEALVKNVIVSSETHYEDVLTYTDIPDIEPADASEKIKLYWKIDGVNTEVTGNPDFNLMFYDTDSDGMYDRISWIAPHLSTQIFEVVIFSDADPGNYSNIGLALLYPADDEYITSNSRIGFNYSVSYNSSTTVYCNLTVDGDVKRENIQTATDIEIKTYFDLSSGQHSWYVNCAGNDGAANTSETRDFTIDLSTPVVTLNTPDYHVSSINSIELNFTPTDTKYPVLVCGLSVNGAFNQTAIVVNNGTLRTIKLTNLVNGVYDWNISCEDAAGNLGSSEERVFYISAGTPSEYNISPNKNSYSMGEVGYLIVSAKAGSNFTMFVDKPLHDSFFKEYTGKTFPFVETLNFTSNAGTYNIDGIFSNGGEMYIVKTSFEVVDSFNAEIETNETTGEPGATFEFESNATGGIGGVDYEWDFGDDTTATGAEIEHTYDSVGEYEVELTATDSKGNIARDTLDINIYNLHHVQVIVKQKLTGNLLEDVPVEVDDQRKNTDSHGSVNFTVYEGKRRIYVAHEDYEWVKQVRNITEDITITIELEDAEGVNNTPVENATSADNMGSEAVADAKESAEKLLAKVSAALEDLESDDKAAKDVLDALNVEPQLQQAKKRIRQALRDLGTIDSSNELDAKGKTSAAADVTKQLSDIESSVAGVEVLETTEYVDYPKTSDVSMLSIEYLDHNDITYSKKQRKEYIEQNNELQSDVTINTRLAIAKLSLVSGGTKTVSIVINTIAKMPVETAGMKLIEYVPKEVAKNADEIIEVTSFEVVKEDPILGFDADVDEYAYYVEKNAGLDNLRKTKHVLLMDPAGDKEGLVGVTGFSVMPRISVDNPKLLLEIVVILLLLLAYLSYHYELPDRIRDWRSKKGKSYETDMAYKPESAIDNMMSSVGALMRKEDEAVRNELTHIRSLVSAALKHAENNMHDEAHESYSHIMNVYKALSREAKTQVHPETKLAFNTILVSKITHMLNEAFLHMQDNQHKKAKDHYSEIKKLYSKLENEHRTAVSARCIRLHEQLFEGSLT